MISQTSQNTPPYAPQQPASLGMYQSYVQKSTIN